MACLLLSSAGLPANTLRVPADYGTIQAALNAASAQDTILVSPGTYRENVAIHKAVCLVSTSGAAVTTIQDPSATTSWGTPETMVILIDAPGPGIVCGLTLMGNDDTNGAGVQVNAEGWRIEQCVFVRNQFGVNSYAASTAIVENSFRLCGLAIGAGKHTQVIGNRITSSNDDGIYAPDSALIENNLLLGCIWSIRCGMGARDTIRNNTITSLGNIFANQQYGVVLAQNADPVVIENNIIAFGNRSGIFTGYNNSNIPNGYVIDHNNVSMNSENYFIIPDMTGQNGNISADPLFCDNDSLFYLASDSPCIDGGSPQIRDGDGSTSDIGMFGGQHAAGVRYAPSSFGVVSPGDQFTVTVVDSPYAPIRYPVVPVSWTPSFDRDPGDTVRYRLILGTNITNTCRNRSCSTYQLANPVDTLYADSTTIVLSLKPYQPRLYYFVVEAYDKSGLIKRSDDVRSLTYERLKVMPAIFSCSQSFPNPCNGIAHIRYSVPYASTVRITLYDVTGRDIRVLVDAYHGTGFYEVDVDASTLASGTYFYRFQDGRNSLVRSLVVLK